MGHRDIIVRLAKNDDGPAVAALVQQNEIFCWENWEIDWSDLEPSWLVAELDGKVVGCIQVCHARPIGRMECLVVDPDLGLLSRGCVVRELTNHAMASIRMFGAQVAASSIPYELDVYHEGALNRGWVDMSEGHLVMKRLV